MFVVRSMNWLMARIGLPMVGPKSRFPSVNRSHLEGETRSRSAFTSHSTAMFSYRRHWEFGSASVARSSPGHWRIPVVVIILQTPRHWQLYGQLVIKDKDIPESVGILESVGGQGISVGTSTVSKQAHPSATSNRPMLRRRVHWCQENQLKYLT